MSAPQWKAMNPVSTTESAAQQFYAKIPTMPRLVHQPNPGQTFDPANSEVLQWMTKTFTPLELAMNVFWNLRTAGVILFDKTDRTWRGRKPEEYEKAKAERKAARAAKLANRKAEKEALRKKPGRPRVVDGAMVEDMIQDWHRGRAGESPRWPGMVEFCAFCTTFTGSDGKRVLGRSSFYRCMAEHQKAGLLIIIDQALVFKNRAVWMAGLQEQWRLEHEEPVAPVAPVAVALPAAQEDDL